MPNWKKVIVSGSNAVLNHITASGNVSGSAISTASFGTYIGDGSQLTNLPSPFPITASEAQIISRSIASGDTDSTALRLLGSGSVSQSGIFEVEGSAGPLFSVADGLDGVLMEVNNISGLPLFQVSSSNEVFINRGNLTSGVNTATASFAMFSGSFQGNASQLTNISPSSITSGTFVTNSQTSSMSVATASFALTSSLVIQEDSVDKVVNTRNINFIGNGVTLTTGAPNPGASVIVAINTGSAAEAFPFTGDAQITGSLSISGSLSIFTSNASNVQIGLNAGAGLTAASEDNVIIGTDAGDVGQAYNTIIIGKNAATNAGGTGLGESNVIIGEEAGSYLNYPQYNVLIGKNAGRGIGAGDHNVYIGRQAGSGNMTTGYYDSDFNTAIGAYALRKNQSGGDRNIAFGAYALYETLASDNIGIGYYAGYNQTTGTGNITIGSGSLGIAGESNQLRIGNGNSLVTISASLETGDVTFYNTASAPNFSGSFQGDGSQLTNLPSTDPFPFTGDAQITGSLVVVSSATATTPTTQSLKIDSNGYFYHLGYYDGGSTAFANNSTNTTIGNDIADDGDYYNTIIGYQAGVTNPGHANVIIGVQAATNGNIDHSVAIGATAQTNNDGDISIGSDAGDTANSKGINIGRYAHGEGVKGIVLNTAGIAVSPTKANTFGIYMTDASPNFEIEATGSSTLSGSSFTIEKSGSTVFEVIGSEGTLFSIDDDLDGTIFTANDRSGLPVLEASASGEVYIGKSPQSLYTTAVISSTTAATTQSIFGLSTSSYGGAFFDYTVQSGSDARAGSIMSVWNGGNISFTETTTTDIGDTTDFNVIVHISQSQAQIASHATRAGYNIKTIIRSI